MQERAFIGLDVHARSVQAGVLDGLTGEVRSLAVPVATKALVTWVCAQPDPAVAYEAGPSRIPRAPGERVKTDRRDAVRLARLLRLEELVAVRVPGREEEARDLVPARENARGDLMRARHRLSKLLLRRGILWEERAWTGAHELWLSRQRFAERPLQIAYEEALAAMLSVRECRDALDAAIAAEAQREPWAEVVACLLCLRGVSTLTAFALTVEIGDWRRFSGRSLGAFLGLTPSESSSGTSQRQGAIARAGNAHARRLLIEAAWQQRRAPGAGVRVQRARAAAPAACASGRGSRSVACTVAGGASTSAASAPRWPPWRSPASSPAGAGAWRSWRAERPLQRSGEASAPGACEEHPRVCYEQPQVGPRSTARQERIDWPRVCRDAAPGAAVTSRAPAPLLFTKLYVPPSRPGIIARPRLMERLNEGLHSQLTLVSAPAGFGKTTLVAKWAPGCGRPVAWLSLDQRDDDPSSFLTYLVAALRTIAPEIGSEAVAALQSPQPPPTESVLTTIVNEISTVPDDFVLILDDYHVLDSRPDDEALTFLLEHLPPRMHLVIATREDPRLPLARLRARGQLTELRAADLRFTPAEATEFLERAAGLDLSADDVEALETRTEGWIAGLQMAAISLQGLPDAAGFIRSFTGSHRFVLDYLLEEVLQRQPVEVQAFLLRTSVLDRLCGPLCDAVLRSPTGSGDETLQAIERANLFIIPLDNERRWYRYHHLFGDLLRRRLGQSLSPGESTELHLRASEWYERDGQLLEAFHHATVADDVERAERLIDSDGMDLHLRSVLMPILDWLASLPGTVLDARPRLLVRSATLALMAVQTTGVEEKLQAAERALQGVELDEEVRDLIGQIACARATLAFTRYDVETMAAQARRAQEYLRPENLPFRFTAAWAATYACLFGGDRGGAARACRECVELAERSGSVFSRMLGAEALGKVQELDNQLHQAAESYRRMLELAGDHPLPNVEEAHLSLAAISYEWNDMDAAERHAQQSRQLARLYDRAIDRSIAGDVFLARVALARGDVEGAAAMLAEAQRCAHDNAFIMRLPEIAAAQVFILIRQGQVAAAARLAGQYDLPLSQARVLIAQGDPGAALTVLGPLSRRLEAQGWADERLRTLVLQAVAQHALGEEGGAKEGGAAHSLGEALALAEPGGFIRLFVDEGAPMAGLLTAAAAQGIRPDYVGRLLAAFDLEARGERSESSGPHPSSSAEPLSPRELEVLRLIAQGLSNGEIGKRLYLALDTVKGHNRRTFEKLGVQRRTEAVARARELGLL